MKVAVVLNAPAIKEKITEEAAIYADGGYRFRTAGVETLAVVGDFDSLAFAPEGEKIIKLEKEKNFTDGEIAVKFAKQAGADEITIYGAFGGALEHVLGNIALLKIAKNIGLKASARGDGRKVSLVSGKINFRAIKGKRISLTPYGGNCTFKESKGLYYPLDGLTLTPADTRGLSNVATEENIEIVFESGEALLIEEE